MPSFSENSLKELKTCHTKLQELLKEAINEFNFSVIEGHRGEERQNRLYREGKSKLRYPDSKHNDEPSLAVDIAPYYPEGPHIRWDNHKDFVLLHGYLQGLAVSQGVTIRSGVNWDMDNTVSDTEFYDWPHIELVNVG